MEIKTIAIPIENEQYHVLATHKKALERLINEAWKNKFCNQKTHKSYKKITSNMTCKDIKILIVLIGMERAYYQNEMEKIVHHSGMGTCVIDIYPTDSVNIINHYQALTCVAYSL